MTHDLGHVTGIASVDRVRVRWIGHELHADAEVALTPALSLVEVHDVLEEARHQLLHSIPRLADVLLHPNPAGTPDAHQRTAHHWAPAT
jgi:divalent metal cation (Fe/Co/Zn/Cd) transporter